MLFILLLAKIPNAAFYINIDTEYEHKYLRANLVYSYTIYQILYVFASLVSK